jgi:hypothetical protein
MVKPRWLVLAVTLTSTSCADDVTLGYWGKPPTTASPKKLLQMGWDHPTTAFVRDNVRAMESRPFDGIVFQLDFAHALFGSTPIALADYAADIANIKATAFQKLTDNFVRVNGTSEPVDWFGDLSTVMANAAVAARFAREAGLRGIVFDTEAYDGGGVWHYPRQRYAATKSFAEYRAAVRDQGRAFMTSIAAAHPDAVVIVTFSYSEAYLDVTERGATTLANANYGLLPAFLDGMLDGAPSGVDLVDGYRNSYYYKLASEFDRARSVMLSEAPRATAESAPAAVAEHVRAGFGLYLDATEPPGRFNAVDFTANYFQPAEFKNCVVWALSHADKYVWLHNERMNWWTTAPTVAISTPPPRNAPADTWNFPTEYYDAVVAARAAVP